MIRDRRSRFILKLTGHLALLWLARLCLIRTPASTRQAAQASQQAIALHYADEDANTLARRSGGKIRAGASNGGGGGEELEDDPPWQRRMTATEERRVRRRLDQLEVRPYLPSPSAHLVRCFVISWDILIS